MTSFDFKRKRFAGGKGLATRDDLNDLSAVYAARGTAATHALVRKLRAGTDTAYVTVLGDSTGNESNEWFQQAMVALAARFPSYRLTTRSWNDTTQAYDAQVVLRPGAVARGLNATTSNGGYITTPDSATLSITGDLDVQAKVQCDDWTPSAAFELCGKSGAAGQAGWFLRLGTDGKLTLFWSPDGTAVLSITSTVAVPFADGATGWVRATIDVDNGASQRVVTFYTSNDGSAWTILGTAVTQAGATSIFDNTTAVTFVGRAAGGPGGIVGQMTAYQLRIFNGINGTLVADLDVADAPNATSSWVDSKGVPWTAASVSATGCGEMKGSPTLALYNGSQSGQQLAYSNDPTRFPKQTPQPTMDLVFISYGHNEPSNVTPRAAFKQLADALLAKYTDCGIVACIQNPQTAPRTTSNITGQASRGVAIRALAASQRYGVVDAYDAFVRSPLGLAALVNPADGIHPTQVGSDLWAAEAGYLFASA